MKERELRELLREASVPGAAEAERRGLEVVAAAFAERQPRAQRTSMPRLALALVAALLLAALVLSPAGAAVRDWVGDVFGAKTPKPEPGLAEIPGGGRLLVQSEAGPWVVRADGSRRLLGDYSEATWSPRGLFVAAVAGRTLTAVEPDGTPRWSLEADAAVAAPRWSPSGFRIAYRRGAELRVTAADGTGDRLLDPRVRPTAPAWSPLGLPQLAYLDAGEALRIVDTESGAELGSAAALPGATAIEWGATGALVEASPTALRVRFAAISKLGQTVEPQAAHDLPLPPGSRLLDVALDASGKTVAALVETRGASGPRSAVLLMPVAGGVARRLLGVPGRLTELAWDPGGERLLVAWPEADQWLFLPVGRGEGRALGGVAAAFAPGHESAAFPRVEGWCCRSSPPGG